MRSRNLLCCIWLLLLVAGGLGLSTRRRSPSDAANHESARPLLLVLNKFEDSLSILDGEKLLLVGTVPTGREPHEVAVSADGRFAFVTNYGSDEKPGSSISIIDIVNLKETTRVDLGALSRPHGIAESDGKIYFTAEGSHAVARLDPAALRLDSIVGTGQIKTHMLVVARGSRKIYAANAHSNSISAIEQDDLGGAIKIGQITVGTAPEGIDLSPDGRELWVAHLGDGGISIIDTATDRLKLTRRVGGAPIRLKFTRDGKRVLVSDIQTGELAVLSAANGKEMRRIQVGPMPLGILVSSDNLRAFVALAGNNSLAVVNLETLSVERTVKVGQGPDGMAWVSR